MITSDHIHRIGGFLIRIALAGGLGMFLLLAVAGFGFTPQSFVYLAPGLLAAALVLFAEGRLPWAAIPVAASSLALTVVLWASIAGSEVILWLAETGGLLILTAWTVRLWDARWGRLATALLLLALFLLPLRSGASRSTLVAEMLMVMGMTMAVLLGVYLRSVDVRRRNALSDVRRGERLELARDLHDFVAHHVTGIVVQAQAAQYIQADDPQRFRQSFSDIEKAGLEALTSMRRLVAVLREGDDGAGAMPLGDLSQVSSLVEKFSVGESYASLYVSPEVASRQLPPELAATAHRIVQESLTNVRKHAHQAATVVVAFSLVDTWLEVAVRDDGRRVSRTRLGGSGGGFGLVGLAERIKALGGQLRAGQRPEGGWEVVARLPLAGPHRTKDGEPR